MRKPLVAIGGASLLAVGILAAELVAAWWMGPRAGGADERMLCYRFPVGREDAELLPEAYQRARPSLRSSDGQIGTIGGNDGGPLLRVGFFEWEVGQGAPDAIEAFRHLPDACMGSAGMELQRIDEPRRHTVDGEEIVFDATVFRPAGGGPAMFVFKGVWMPGLEAPDLRTQRFGRLGSGEDLRVLRLRAARERFRPYRARVVTGAVSGVPDGAAAWSVFEHEVLAELRIEREENAASTGAADG